MKGSASTTILLASNFNAARSLNKIDISHITNTLGKGMNPIILPPAMGK